MDYFHFDIPKKDLNDLSNLSLAYVGDAVFELMIRSQLCLSEKVSAGKLHKAALDYVAAPRQAEMSTRILSRLTEEEQEVFRRGRNSKTHAIPKAAKRSEYQLATALECLFAWLFLQGKTDRLNELLGYMLQEEAQPDEGRVHHAP